MLFILFQYIIILLIGVRINIDKPLWDQSTFLGRFKHFSWTTDPTTCFASEKELDAAKVLVEQYR